MAADYPQAIAGGRPSDKNGAPPLGEALDNFIHQDPLAEGVAARALARSAPQRSRRYIKRHPADQYARDPARRTRGGTPPALPRSSRSEEHTSELQSRP